MALALSEVVLIIGRRQTQTSVYDCVAIIPSKSAKFAFSDPPIAVPIPSTSTSTTNDTKMVPLRRVTRKVTITGEIMDGNDVFSKTGVTLSDANGTISGGSSVTSVLKKKWILEEIFAQGAAGEGMTMQYRGVIAPSANPQTSPPTAPSDETKNMWHKLGKIIDLQITDDGAVATMPQGSFTRYLPEKMDVSITIQWGSVQT